MESGRNKKARLTARLELKQKSRNGSVVEMTLFENSELHARNPPEDAEVCA